MTEHPDAAAIRRWQPGETVALRHITTRDGTPGATRRCLVVADRDDLVALFIPGGTTYKEWLPHHSDPNRRLGDKVLPHDALLLMFPGRGYSVRLLWRGEERAFRGYYVNFEEPFRRTAIGFDTNDHTLDIVVQPDLRWAWKDEDDFAARVQQGIYSEAFAASVRAEAAGVIADIEARRPPFSGGWERWTPDPAWGIPELPPTWASEPVAAWERWAWAYPAAQ